MYGSLTLHIPVQVALIISRILCWYMKARNWVCDPKVKKTLRPCFTHAEISFLNILSEVNTVLFCNCRHPLGLPIFGSNHNQAYRQDPIQHRQVAFHRHMEKRLGLRYSTAVFGPCNMLLVEYKRFRSNHSQWPSKHFHYDSNQRQDKAFLTLNTKPVPNNKSLLSLNTQCIHRSRDTTRCNSRRLSKSILVRWSYLQSSW